jgi:hypothetical protein
MTTTVPPPIDVDREQLRTAIQMEYAEVALHPTMVWLMPRIQRAVPYVGYITVSGVKPAGSASSDTHDTTDD